MERRTVLWAPAAIAAGLSMIADPLGPALPAQAAPPLPVRGPGSGTTLGADLFARMSEGAPTPVGLRAPTFADPAVWTLDSDHRAAAVDVQPGRGRRGTPALTISVPRSAVGGWPRAVQRLGPVAAGRVLRMDCWVSVAQVADGAGAYLALACLDADGERLSVEQSPGRRGSHDWVHTAVAARVPAGTAAVEVTVILHGSGTAHFSQVGLTVDGSADPVHAAAVTATATTTVLNERVEGFGHELNPQALVADWNPMSAADRERLVALAGDLRATDVRVFVDCAWRSGMAPDGATSAPAAALLETCRLARRWGARLNLVMWRPNDWDPADPSAPGEAMADVMDWLAARGIVGIELLTVYNEPPYEFDGTPAQFTRAYRAARATLDRRGHTGTGLVAENYQGPLLEQTAALADVVTEFGYHRYLDHTADLRAEVERFTTVADQYAAVGRPVRVWESNITVPGSNWTAGAVAGGTLIVDEFAAALKLMTYYLHLLAAGATGVSHWDLFDYAYGDDNRPQRFGLLGTAAEGLPVRATYALYRRLSAHLVPGSRICRVRLTPDESLIAYSAEAEGVPRTTWLVNPWERPCEVRLSGFRRVEVLDTLAADTWRNPEAPMGLSSDWRRWTSGPLTLPAESLTVFRDGIHRRARP